MSELVQLRHRAESVLCNISEKPLDRPVFIEFSGTPKSGKSTCIDIVAHFFRRLNFKALAPTEGASKRTPYYLKDNWVAFNTWSASYALTHILEGLYSSDKYHLAILDRGLFDTLAWFQVLLDRDAISQETCDKVHQFLIVDEWKSVIDEVFLFRADADTSLERENQNTLIDDPGSAMNLEFLTALNEAYESVQHKYSSNFRHFEKIDTSKSECTNPQSTAAKVVTFILDRFDRD